MPFDAGLAHRLEEILDGKHGFQQKRMFGGIGWLLNGNMCVGVYKDWLIVRVGEKAATSLMKAKHVKPMDITGKPMKGWAMTAPEAISEDEDLRKFVDMAVDFVATLPEKT